MFGLTKLALKRPVTVILALITILYFGLQAIFGAKLELMPEMNFPMMVVSTTYIGVSPTDIETCNKACRRRRFNTFRYKDCSGTVYGKFFYGNSKIQLWN